MKTITMFRAPEGVPVASGAAPAGGSAANPNPASAAPAPAVAGATPGTAAPPPAGGTADPAKGNTGAPAAGAKPGEVAKVADPPADPLEAERNTLKTGFRELSKRQYDIEQKAKALEATGKKYAAFDNLDKVMREHPLEGLKILGIDPVEHLHRIARSKDGKAPEPTPAEQIKELRAEQERMKKADIDRAAKEQELERAKVKATFEKGIEKTILAGAEGDYKLLALEGAEGTQAVFEVISKTYVKRYQEAEAEGRAITDAEAIMSVDEAAKMVEAHLKKSFDAKRAKLDPAAPQTAPPATANGQQKSKTLTSDHTATASAAAPARARTETFDEKIDRLSKTLFKPKPA